MKEITQDLEMEIFNEKQIFIKKVEMGLIQIEQGQTVSHDEVKEIIKDW